MRSERVSVHRSLLSDVRAPTGNGDGVDPAKEMMWLNCLYKKELSKNHCQRRGQRRLQTRSRGKTKKGSSE